MSTEEILAHIGRLAVSGQWPADAAARLELLLNSGFEEQSARSALGMPMVGSPRRNEVPVLNLSEAASGFLVGLRDLGYLTADMEDEVLDLLLEEAPAELAVGLEDVRRAVASVLFERQGELDKETRGFLDEEWRIAFH
ncbi:MAG: hypothetical protein KDA24_20360 [Deltaproteobacteria bacterium]|nr:hypothetical protein [Deltaproteobacteria bacterium]